MDVLTVAKFDIYEYLVKNIMIQSIVFSHTGINVIPNVQVNTHKY